MYYPLSAFLILFVNCLQNPFDSYIASDVELLGLITSVLSPALPDSHPSPASTALDFFRKMKDTAKQYVAEMHSLNRRKGKRTRDDTGHASEVPSQEPPLNTTVAKPDWQNHVSSDGRSTVSTPG